MNAQISSLNEYSNSKKKQEKALSQLAYEIETLNNNQTVSYQELSKHWRELLNKNFDFLLSIKSVSSIMEFRCLLEILYFAQQFYSLQSEGRNCIEICELIIWIVEKYQEEFNLDLSSELPYTEALISCGTFCRLSKQYDKAIFYLEKALELLPNNTKAETQLLYATDGRIRSKLDILNYISYFLTIIIGFSFGYTLFLKKPFPYKNYLICIYFALFAIIAIGGFILDMYFDKRLKEIESPRY